MSLVCSYCREDPPHSIQQCPKALAIVDAGVPLMRDEVRSDADDVFDQLRDRFLRTRVFAGQLARLLSENAIAIPPEVSALNPDSYLENAQ